VNVGLLIVRVVVGALFVGHGTQKLFGWFGGDGLDGTAGWYESIGFRPGRPMAMLGGCVEAAGGLLLVLGLLTPLACALIIGQMVAAAVAVHLDNGLWNSNGGFELNLVYATTALGVAFVGPGTFSMDEAMNLSNSGSGYAVGALLVGVGAAMLVEAFRRAQLRDVGEAAGAQAAERKEERRAA
jgi:putative oxidoreductase